MAIADSHFHVQQNKRLNRTQFHEFFVNLEPANIVMETCGTAHYWARTFTDMGYHITLLTTQYVKPYVRRNKTDRYDAIALVEAARNHEIKSVPIKSNTNCRYRYFIGYVNSGC